MVSIKIKPELHECVETKAKKEYQRISGLVLNGNKQKGLLKRLELLRLFLETADFPRLRSDSEKYLEKGHEVIFLISDKCGSAITTMQVK